MTTFKSMAKSFVVEETGMETVEYAVIAALIVAVGAAALTGLGAAVKDKFTALATIIGGS